MEIDLVKELKPDTLAGIRMTVANTGIVPGSFDYSSMDFSKVTAEQLEQVIELLKATEDLPIIFPRGKSATIQRLQLLVCESREFGV
jgi:hypothetical protein